MKYLLILCTLVSLVACSVKSDEENQAGNQVVEQQNVENDIKEPVVVPEPEPEPEPQPVPDPAREDIDSDGDFVFDKVEIESGRNPNIADLPDIRMRFLQHYKILVSYKEISSGKTASFSIDTKRISDDPSFKYRVGEIFFRNNSLKSAANVGRFSGHSHGNYKENDLSWVTYPEIDSRFFLEQTMKYRKFFDESKYLIQNVQVELENSMKLKGNSVFKQISNPVMTFRFYNYESESYEIIHSEPIDRTLTSGVNEVISIKIANINPKLIKENFFQRGEFIISELTDYEIPELETNYLTLSNSIREKSIPIVYNTPLETSVFYVAINKGKNFNDILSTLFDDNVVIEKDRLTSIYQFRNSLPSYQYLSDLKDEDKKGDWFVFTNKLNKHFLDYNYTNKDIISLSYVLGVDLSRQDNEKVFSFRESVSSSNSSKTYPLGNIATNSEVSLILTPRTKSGQELIVDGGEVRNGPCSGRNCVSFPMLCRVRIHGFKNFSKSLNFNQSFKEELERISLIINQDEFKLHDLVSKKLINTSFNNGNLVIMIRDINSIKKLSNTDENVIFLRAYGKNTTHFEGVRLESAEGRGWHMCANVIGGIAYENKIPINIDSFKFNEWAHNLNWSVLSKSQNKTIYESFIFGISSMITNRFN